MSEDKRGSELTGYHNKGEQDSSQGKYEPPHKVGVLDTIVYPQSTIDKMVEDNNAYKSGYDNDRKNR